MRDRRIRYLITLLFLSMCTAFCSIFGALAAADAERPKILEFYAEWCPPCKQMRPIVQKLHKKYVSKFDVIPIDIDNPTNAALVRQYDISAVPTLIFVSRNGNACAKTVGYSGPENVHLAVKQLLSQETADALSPAPPLQATVAPLQ